MKKKEPIKVSMSTFFLIIAIIVIAGMGYLMFKFYHEKIVTENRVADLNNQVNRLQEKINNISEITSNTNTSTNTNYTTNTVDSTDKISNKSSNNATIKLGMYLVNEINVTPDPETYGIASVQLKSNNEFSVDMPLGTSYVGTYSVDENNLVCNANRATNSEGGYGTPQNSNITFTFQTINENKIKFIKASQSGFELTEGMTYSFYK